MDGNRTVEYIYNFNTTLVKVHPIGLTKSTSIKFKFQYNPC